MTLVLCSCCNRHIFHPEAGGDDVCPFCATQVVVAATDAASNVSATSHAVGATVVAALVALSMTPACVPVDVYGSPPVEDELWEDSETIDGTVPSQDADGDGSNEGSSREQDGSDDE